MPGRFSYLRLAALLLALSVLGGEIFSAITPEYMGRPVAVMTVAGWNRLEDDLHAFAELTEVTRPLHQLHEFERKLGGLPGLDRDAPLAAMLFLPTSVATQPTALFAVPVVDGQAFITALNVRIPLIEPDGEDHWLIKAPDKTIHFQIHDNWLLISEDEGLKALIDETFLTRQRAISETFDVHVEIDPHGIPESVRQLAMVKLNADLDRELVRKESESSEEYQLRRKLVELIRGGLQAVMSSTESIEAGITIDNGFKLSADWNVADQSELSRFLNSLPLSVQSAPVPAENPPATIQYGLQLPEPVREFGGQVYHAIRSKVRKELGPKLAEKDRGPIVDAFDSIKATIDAGAVSGILAVRQNEDRQMMLIGGVKMTDVQKVATSLKTIMPYAAISDELSEVEPNAWTSGSLMLHRVRGQGERKQDREVYGPDASLYVGTDNSTFWLAAGGKDTPRAVEQLMAAESKKSNSLLSAAVAMRPWIELGEKNGDTSRKFRDLQSAFPDQENDEIRLEISVRESGAHIELDAQSGYLRLLGIGVKRDEQKTQR